MTTPTPTDTVNIQEVGLRDGLQNEPVVLTVEERARLVEAFVRAGLKRIQIGSLVNPRRVPQMAGTDRVWKMIRKGQGVRYSVLVLNERGLEHALAEEIPHIEVYVSASDTHSRKNSGVSLKQALSSAVLMVSRAVAAGAGVTAGVMCAFGCHYEGGVSRERVLEIVSEMEAACPTEIALADTTGMADPGAVKEMIRVLGETTGSDRISLHLHDTRSLGMANLIAALEAGIRSFDTSVGGLGGCPFIPGAAGNISTEAAVEVLETMGYKTGIAAEELLGIRSNLESLLGRVLSRT